MDTPVLMTIADFKDWGDGNCSVTDHTGKRWKGKVQRIGGLAQFKGQQVEAMTSVSNYQGKEYHWINDFHTLPAGPQQPYTQPVPQPQPQSDWGQAPEPPKPTVDRDASIVAQTLCKTITFSNVEEAWTAYATLYSWYLDWDHVIPATENVPGPQWPQPQWVELQSYEGGHQQPNRDPQDPDW